jgi:hypothetical protein|tara:strand:- start:1545 stop:1724 length:180 start_codon:yes stop_codon:yes gene_type:complete
MFDNINSGLGGHRTPPKRFMIKKIGIDINNGLKKFFKNDEFLSLNLRNLRRCQDKVRKD